MTVNELGNHSPISSPHFPILYELQRKDIRLFRFAIPTIYK